MLRPLALSLLLLAVASPAQVEGEAARGWEPGRRDEGPGYAYQLFSQAAPEDDFVRYQVRGTISASPRALRRSVRVIAADPEHAPAGHTRRVIEATPGSFLVHTHIALPFLSDRDILTRGVGSVDEQGVHRIEWQAVEDPRVPESPDAIRIQQAAGFWEFAPNGDGTTRVTYETYLDLGGAIPRWLVSRLMPGMVAGNFSDVASVAQQTPPSVAAPPPREAP